MREPSGDATTARAWALSDGAKEVFRLPVVRSKDSRLFRGVRLVPGAAPAGRAFAKLPPAYTVLPTTASDHTTPSICTVGNPSAVTPCAERCAIGGGPDGAAAAAGPAPDTIGTANAPMTVAATAINDAARLLMR